MTEPTPENSPKTYHDLKNSLDTAREEGREEGVELTIEVINLYNEGKTASEIAKLVSIEQQRVEQILKKLK
jgi:hypothetical protein